LTIPDLVVLGLLSEEPRHGYDLARTLEEREAADWAAISRPQVYYSLRKLERRRLIVVAHDRAKATGPERQVYRLARSARAALRRALDNADWVCQRPPPPFVTWVALAQYAPQGVVRERLDQRRAFLRGELEKEQRTRGEIETDSRLPNRLARSMVGFAIRQFQLELDWIDELKLVFGRAK
jgi:DNA-binding PadR family transcriptional regulator